MSASIARGWVKAGIVLMTSAGAINVFAMGCRHGNYAMTPMAASPMVNVTPYGVHHSYGYDPPVTYGYGRPITSHGAFGRSPQMATKGYVYAPPGETESANAAPEPSSSGDVDISQMRFQPDVIAVKTGESITWRNSAGMPHTVSGRSDGGPASGTISSGQAFSHTFDEPGTYEYYCALHPGMTGKVIVQ